MAKVTHEHVSDEWQSTSNWYIDQRHYSPTSGRVQETSRQQPESRVAEMTQESVVAERKGSGGDEWVSEYTAKRDIASVVLTAAKGLGLIDDDTIGSGSASRFVMLDRAEKEALSFDSVAELAKPKGDPGQQAKTYRAAFKLAGVTVSEMTEAQLAQMERHSVWLGERQKMIDDFAKRSEVQEQERNLAQFGTNRMGIRI